MAVRDEIRQQRQKLKGQGFKAHWEYFWDDATHLRPEGADAYIELIKSTFEELLAE